MKPFENAARAARGALTVMAAVFCCAPAHASSSTSWEMSSYRDFLAGRFSGVSLTREGRLTLAPALETLFASDQPVIWTIAQAPDGSIYAGTGHRGRLYHIVPNAKPVLVWTADQPEIFTLAIDSKGVLYAATSPGGKIYRIENGQAQEYFDPKARYIWSLAFGADGALYAGTGDQGKIYRIAGPGKGEVYYDTGQAHVTCLAVDAGGRLLAGSEPNGMIYRISGKDRAFVLYDAALPEIRTLVPMPDGTVYAAALGGSLSKRTQGAGVTPATGGGSISVTTTAASVPVADDSTAAQGGAELKPKPDASKVQASTAPAQAAQSVAQPTVDLVGVEKSALYHIANDNTVETVWSSKEENVYDMLASGSGQLLFSTDVQGRIYRLNPDRKMTLLAQTNEGETTRLLSAGGSLLAATGEMGKIYRLGTTPGTAGTYESPVHDVGTVARWGRLSWRGDALDPNGLVLRVRTGNSARPDKTWSDWSEPLTNSKGSSIPSPNARYVQWRAEFKHTPAQGPALDNVSLAYLPQNTAPVIKAISVVTQLAASGVVKPALQTAPATYSITVTDTGEATTPAGTPTQTLSRATAEQIQITWQAEDAEGDRMLYALYFRGEDEREWKLLKANLLENTFLVDADVLADGKYFFRVTASDSLSNPPSTAREAELVSAPVLIDHTPPVVTVGTPRRIGNRVEIEFEAVDAASPLKRCEYSLDAGNWVPMEPLDGIIDSAQEKFLLRLDNLAPGEHLIVLRAFDTANNAGLAKVVVR
jgi:hypothetical protein